MSKLDRYGRQMRFAPLGASGQRRLLVGRVAVCGLGALGSVLANGLVRAGVGFVRLIDRDFVELNNLQRQLLYDESDARERRPKAIAAAEKLRAVNGDVVLDARVCDLNYSNIAGLCDDVALVLDGTDNFETRFLINDYAVARPVPWVYAGCVGSVGQSMTIVPGRTACLRCLIDSVPAPGQAESCETAGVLAAVAAVLANVQLAEAMKILVGDLDAVRSDLLMVDVWYNRWRTIRLEGLRERGTCPVCGKRQFDWLTGRAGSQSTVLCGRNAVQVLPDGAAGFDFAGLPTRLEALGNVRANRHLVHFDADGYDFSIFPDGRAIIQGTDDTQVARSLYARYLGS